MAPPLTPPKKRNPILRLQQPTLPPAARSRIALHLTAAAAEGRFELQTCDDCCAWQYPPREACVRCLSVQLTWQVIDGTGELISDTTVRHSNELYHRERVPFRLGLVQLREGPILLTHVHADCSAAPAAVRVQAHLDKAGQAALIALPGDNTVHLSDDKVMRDMTSDPKMRKILVTDCKTAVGQAMVTALIDAGADMVWAGVAEPWKRPPGLGPLEKLSNVTVVPLDLTDARSVDELAASIGGKVDILVNTAELHRTQNVANRRGTESARAEMEIGYFGLLRLSQAFAPAMHARAAEGTANATAWVNVLSIFALSTLPSQTTFSASKAAAFSLAQGLRAELRSAGIRVINVFPGPVDEEWNQLVPPPKLAPSALAAAIIKGLRDGVEDIYPGDVAQDLLTRWRDSAKVLERELASE
jgi:NAD(P)-dependent dehydrogenase (short-subunit alcohol dehydrogenase family)/uncharacterized OB-fold protein